MIRELEGQARIVSRTHYLVQFFARPNSDDLVRELGSHGSGQIDDPNGWDFWNKNFTTTHPLEILQHEVHPLLQGDPEPCHSRIGYWQMIAAGIDAFLEERHHGSARANDIPVSHD